MKRRDFLAGASSLAGAGLLSQTNAVASSPRAALNSDDPNIKPNQAQKAWMDLGFGMFIHFGVNTYHDAEWSDGSLDQSKFNPDQIDTDRWMQTAKNAGMKYVVLVAKHHDSFCLWPSKYGNYGVAHTPFKKDLLGMLVESANKYGLKMGVYYSLWDRRVKTHDTDIYRYIHEFMMPQLEELLTQYGEMIELWFDGFWKYQRNGWTKKNQDIDGEAAKQEFNEQRNNKFIQAWRNEGAYHWQMDFIYQQVKRWQPNCLVMNNSTTAYPGVPLHPVDIRSGEKYTEVTRDQKVWNWLGDDIYLPMQIETTMSIQGNERFPSGNWYWHAWDQSVASKELIQNYLSVADSMDANLLLNVGPSDRGLLREVDERVLKSLQA